MQRALDDFAEDVPPIHTAILRAAVVRMCLGLRLLQCLPHRIIRLVRGVPRQFQLVIGGLPLLLVVVDEPTIVMTAPNGINTVVMRRALSLGKILQRQRIRVQLIIG